MSRASSLERRRGRTPGGHPPTPPQGEQEHYHPPEGPPPDRLPDDGPPDRGRSEYRYRSRSRHDPLQKERGRKPDPFTKKSEYRRFLMQTNLYLRQNEKVYPTHADKIIFALEFFTEGLPQAWAELFATEHAAAAPSLSTLVHPFGTWQDFLTHLQKTFGDPNEERNEMNSLDSLTMKQGQTAVDFFQEFELYALRADLMKDHRTLIRLIEEKVHRHLVRAVYHRGTIPDTYEAYRDAIILADTIEQQFRASTSKGPSPSSASKDTEKKRTKAKSKPDSQGKKKPFFFPHPKVNNTVQQQEASIPKQDDKCHLCGKVGHWKKDCPNLKKIHQLRAHISGLSEAEQQELAEPSF